MAFTRKQLGLPYLFFLILFVLFPLIIIFYYALTDSYGHLTLSNFISFFTNPKALGTLFYSAVIAFLATAGCMLLAYPTAYILARGRIPRGAAWLVIIVLPMWINFTLRMTALKEILSAIEGNLAYYPFVNTVIGMIYDFMPFMVMPLYNSLEKLDQQIIEAAYDLGASKFTVFVKVILPMSTPGIVSGITMVFLPAMTNYVVLDMLYNSTYIMGSLIGSYFSAFNWHSGSMVSAVLLVLIGFMTWLGGRAKEVDRREGERL
ncbi:MAG: ABC transporter permease [Lachnospiraceae bacterium]|nr:ABC transporter permease [Lachnospiraceae bacterium]